MSKPTYLSRLGKRERNFCEERNKKQKAEETSQGEEKPKNKGTYENKGKGHFRSFLKVWRFGKSWEFEDLESGRNEFFRHFIQEAKLGGSYPTPNFKEKYQL